MVKDIILTQDPRIPLHPHLLPRLAWIILRGLGAGVLMSDALQGCERHVQATVRAGPEGAQTVTVQVGVTLQQSEGVRTPASPAGSPRPFRAKTHSKI